MPIPLIRIKEKYQVTLPTPIRQEADLAVGDLLEAKLENGKITLTPKSAIDRELVLATKDLRARRYLGPFRTAKTAQRVLHRAAKYVK